MKRRLWLLLLGLTLITVTFLVLGMLRKLERDQLFKLEEEMVTTARALIPEARATLLGKGSPQSLSATLVTTQNATGTRIRILDEKRNLVADSVTGAPSPQDQLRFRPEIQAAFVGGYGAYTRFSDETARSLALFAAVPIEYENRVVGAVYVSHTTDAILHQLGTLRRSANRALLLLAGVVFAGAVLMTGKVQNTLRQLGALTGRVSTTEPKELPITGDTRVAEIGENFNRLISSLREKISELEAERTKTKLFLEDVAHELKTPITGLKGSVETLRSAGLTEPDRDRLWNNVEKETSRLSDLTSRLLELQKLDYTNLKFEPFDLLSVAETVVDTFDCFATGKDVKLEIEEASLGPFLARGDVGQIQRVVENLLENAVRCSPKGSTVCLRLRKEKGCSTLVVADEGPGPPDGELFKRHKRGETNSGSLGLGLSIASEIMRKHGRELQVEGSPGGGSVFRICLDQA